MGSTFRSWRRVNAGEGDGRTGAASRNQASALSGMRRKNGDPTADVTAAVIDAVYGANA